MAERGSNDTMNPPLPEAIAALKDRARVVRSAGSPESLLGHEGTAARLYFQALATTFRGPIAFAGARQPPGPRPGQRAALAGLHPAGQPAGRPDRGPRPRPGPGHLPRGPSRQAQPGPGPARGAAPPDRGPVRDAVVQPADLPARALRARPGPARRGAAGRAGVAAVLPGMGDSPGRAPRGAGLEGQPERTAAARPGRRTRLWASRAGAARRSCRDRSPDRAAGRRPARRPDLPPIPLRWASEPSIP